ncbi:MAG TPA: type 1 glutamine amidotransferase [Thermodesulfobacteriota bacterium]|nr:type 1 glutamine amidotransferase [Thermodesulfobacteriota bacterium]
MKVVIIMHDPSEGPGTIEDYLALKGIDVYTVRLYACDLLPQALDDYDAVVTMGGPMNVYEDEKYPFLRDEVNFLTQTMDRGVPILGICLGAQMIARACGASVFKASQKEVGWSEVFLTDTGKKDMLFRGLSETLPVFQWHEDTFELPVGGHLLATSAVCPHQAFRCSNAYGLQFHVEVTPQILFDWFGLSPDGEKLIRYMETLEVDFKRHAQRLYSNFVDWVKAQGLS